LNKDGYLEKRKFKILFVFLKIILNSIILSGCLISGFVMYTAGLLQIFFAAIITAERYIIL